MFWDESKLNFFMIISVKINISYHHEAKSIAEQVNRPNIIILRKFVEKKEWYIILLNTVFAYDFFQHKITWLFLF